MNEKETRMIEHLLDLSSSYYTEETSENGETINSIPDDQSERDFIQEVFMICCELLDKFE